MRKLVRDWRHALLTKSEFSAALGKSIEDLPDLSGVVNIVDGWWPAEDLTAARRFLDGMQRDLEGTR